MIKTKGRIEITPKLTDYDKFYLFNFNKTSHIKRDPKSLELIFKNKNGYNGNYGIEGEFFIYYNTDVFGNTIKNIDPIIYDKTKSPPSTQPNDYFPWIPNIIGNHLLLDTENYRNSISWLKWLTIRFFSQTTNKYKLNGELFIYDKDRKKTITIVDNEITYKSTSKKIKKISSDYEIINKINVLTDNFNLDWSLLRDKQLSSEIKISGGVSVCLFVNYDNMNIYIKKGKELEHYKFIKDSDIYYLYNKIKHIIEK